MSRLDQNGGNGPKTVVALTPDTKQVRENLMNRTGEPVDLGPIQSAASYGKRIQARRTQASDVLKGKAKPLGGAPPLDPEKMRALAQNLLPRPSFDTSPPPDDRDHEDPGPQMIGGVGSGYHINQEMAHGNVDAPVSLREAQKMIDESRKKAEQATPVRKPLSRESLEALEHAKESMEQEPVEEPEETPKADHRLKDDITDKELEKATASMVNPRPDMFDFESIAAAQKSLISPDRRKSIESRLQPLDIADMIVKREIQQTVPIIAGKLTYHYRTFNQHENLFCLRHVYEIQGSVAYVEELLNTAKLVCSLVAINGAMLPDHRKGVGTDHEEVDKELFEKKMFHVANFPVQLIADISVNAIWFNERVTKLFSVENLKNG